ncbi:MAG: tol-pal system protein YbgF [Rhodobacteraceae bacterium]|nr:tol-pal system protein YbgF [Paracoccaceae bacterium]
MTRLLATFALGLLLAAPAASQGREETLADIRQELSVLYVEVQRLNRELSTTGGANAPRVSGSLLERVDLIEAELSRLTAKTEELEFRIGRVVSDGTNRIGDLEFRLCELEAGCDIASLGDTPRLGGEAGGAGMATPPSQPSYEGGTQMAVAEQADFDRALSAYKDGDYSAAQEGFADFVKTYTGGPLTGEAHFYRGEALYQLGQRSAAARAYLDSFSGSPQGARAPDALYKLGVSLADLGQTSEACVTLREVGVRFPASPINDQARAKMRALSCQ